MRFLCRVAICTLDRLSEHPWIASPEVLPMNIFNKKEWRREGDSNP